mmetsp:Transcript_19779/g.54947  ORF Transcript_19779/g.54947 Transcript_19779/m.54947 type:complete len:200 (-) Transcript_19779:307-906(-)
MSSLPDSGSSERSEANVTTRPPKVGSSLNQPMMGITVRPNMMVSNSERISALPKSRCCATRPTVEVPQLFTCKSCSLKNREDLEVSSNAACMAIKKGELLKSWQLEYTSSQSPVSSASPKGIFSCMEHSCVTSSRSLALLPSYAPDMRRSCSWPRSTVLECCRICSFNSLAGTDVEATAESDDAVDADANFLGHLTGAA